MGRAAMPAFRNEEEDPPPRIGCLGDTCPSVVWAILADSLTHEVAVFLGTAVANVAYHHRLAAPNRDPYARRMATVHFGKG